MDSNTSQTQFLSPPYDVMSLADALGTILKSDDTTHTLPSESNDVFMDTHPHDHEGEDDPAQDPDEDMQDLFGEDADNRLDE